MSSKIRIEIAWPHKYLSPNARVGWKAKHRIVRDTRHKAGWAARDAKGRETLSPGPIRVTTIFYPPDRRARDEDNLKASMKAIYDGIADGIGVDDKFFRHEPVVIGEPIKGGRVVVELEAA